MIAVHCNQRCAACGGEYEWLKTNPIHLKKICAFLNLRSSFRSSPNQSLFFRPPVLSQVSKPDKTSNSQSWSSSTRNVVVYVFRSFAICRSHSMSPRGCNLKLPMGESEIRTPFLGLSHWRRLRSLVLRLSWLKYRHFYGWTSWNPSSISALDVQPY